MFNRRLFLGTFPLFSFILLLLSLFDATNAITGNSLPIHEANSQADEPQAKCTFGVHVKGPDGAEVKDVTLDQELYYKIRCESVEGYCLRVANCSVSADSDDQKPPYLIIDGRGCTTEPSLFEHVQYEDAFTAGIYNPYPIRFRGQKSAVQFNCVTTLSLLNADGKCQRENCTWNQYSREANEQKVTTTIATVTEKAKKKKKKVE